VSFTLTESANTRVVGMIMSKNRFHPVPAAHFHLNRASTYCAACPDHTLVTTRVTAWSASSQ
jgi:hypothetical protein